ncbi:ABC transporter permease [Robertmurraya sp. FSL W8-0741]|uniref:ABC transporter permease n=1 Tax=Robertmurraya sp. FSL W8-0741 TaxID=2954629 RepID=UPI0030FBEA5F
MKGLIFRQFKHRFGASLLFLCAFILIFTITPFVMLFLENSQKQVESDISFYGRGSYDLLVRPLGIESEIEKKRGIVHENYIGFGKGGISIDQWKEIQDRSDIEIAAPVASLGYFTGIRSNIGIQMPESSTRYVGQFKTTDGINHYPISEKYVCAMLETAGTLPLEVKRLYPKFEIIYSHSLLNLCTGEAVQFPLPVTYHLLVGIDPVEEEKLTGIAFEGINEENPKSGYAAMNQSAFPHATLIPVLDNQDATVSVELHALTEELDIGPEDTKKYRNALELSDEYKRDDVNFVRFEDLWNRSPKAYNDFLSEIEQLPPTNSKKLTIDMSPMVNPFNQDKAIMLNADGEMSELIAGNGYVQELDFNYTSEYYRASQLIYEEKNGMLTIKKLGEENNVPLYREIEKVGMTLTESLEHNEPVWIIDPVGEFAPGKRQDTLASSPLGIYQQAPVTLKDKDGKEKTVQATAIPGSFVTPAASGVTNIHLAALIKGEKAIDAIRVKVAGIDSYTKAAAKKIEKVASELEAMGLHVSIVAGASPQKLDVNVEGLGTVTESWTTLGATGTLVNQWDLTNMVLSIAFFFVAATYVINRILFWQVTKERELKILNLLGWNRRHVMKFLRMEVFFLTGIAWIISLAGITVFQTLRDTSVSIYIWHSGLTLATFLFLSYFAGKIGRKNTPQRKNGKIGKGLFLKNISFYRKYIRSPFIQLMFVSGLSTYVYLSLTETVQQTSVTILGEYVNLQSSSWHILLIICAYLLAILTLAEGFTSLLTARQQEIGIFRSIGWKNRHIIRFYLQEIGLWSACSIIIGNVLCIILFSSLFGINHTMWIVCCVSAIGFFLVVILFALINLVFFLKKDLTSTLQLRRRNSFKKLGKEQINPSKLNQ